MFFKQNCLNLYKNKNMQVKFNSLLSQAQFIVPFLASNVLIIVLKHLKEIRQGIVFRPWITSMVSK